MTPSELASLAEVAKRLLHRPSAHPTKPNRPKLTGKKRSPDDERIARFRQLRLQGHTYRQISQITGYSASHICQTLTEWDCQRVAKQCGMC